MKKHTTKHLTIVAVILIFIAIIGLIVGAVSLIGDVNSDGKFDFSDVQELLKPIDPDTPAPPKTPDVPTAPPIDPNAIAAIDNGGSIAYVTSVEEMVDSVDISGNTQITLLKDISHSKAIDLPYSCSIDFAGCTVTTNPEIGLGLHVRAAGEENQTTTLKNGKLVSFSDSLRAKEGAVVVENMQLNTAFGTCVVLYDTDAVYKDINQITGSTLISDAGAAISFGEQDADFSKTGFTLENSTLVCHKADGAQVFTKAGSNSVAGVITLGSNVKMYSYNDTACAGGMVFLGNLPVKEKNVTAAVGEQSWENMTCWSSESDVEVLDILMVGNSFCHSFVDELYAIADTQGIQLNVTNLYYAGCSIKSHWEWLQNPAGGKACEFFITGPMGRYEHPTITTLAEALEFAQWDVITCQQHFSAGRTVDYATALESCTPYAADMFSYLKQNYPDAQLYWQETWSYGVGYQHPNNKDEDTTNDKPQEDVPTVAVQTHQYEIIRDVSKALCAESNVLMIPTGDAWQLARAQLGDTLNRSDYAHDGDGGGGQYLNACVWLEVLTGESCVGNTWRPTEYILFEARVPELQKAAHEAVAAVYGEDYAK